MAKYKDILITSIMNDPFVLSLASEERDELLNFYKAKLAKILKEKEKVESLIDKLSHPSNQATSPNFEEKAKIVDAPKYRESWSWTLKTKFALQVTQKCLTSRDIINTIKEYEDLGDKDPINSVSGTLSQKTHKGVVFKRWYPYEGSESYYGLIEWWNGEELRDEYKPL